jgi:hypothetical protein
MKPVFNKNVPSRLFHDVPECDPALALLSDYVNNSNMVVRIGAIFGLGLAYAGSNRSDIIQHLLNSE